MLSDVNYFSLSTIIRIELFEKGKYNDTTSPSGEAINGEVIYKIADLAKILHDLIKKRVE